MFEESDAIVTDGNAPEHAELPRFALRDMFLIMTLVGVLMVLWRVSPPFGFFWSVVAIPTAVGIRLRINGASLGTCLWLVVAISIAASGLISAAGSAWALYHDGDFGYFDRNAWRTILAAGLAGAVVGALFAVIPMGILLLAEAVISHLMEPDESERELENRFDSTMDDSMAEDQDANPLSPGS